MNEGHPALCGAWLTALNLLRPALKGVLNVGAAGLSIQVLKGLCGKQSAGDTFQRLCTCQTLASAAFSDHQEPTVFLLELLASSGRRTGRTVCFCQATVTLVAMHVSTSVLENYGLTMGRRHMKKAKQTEGSAFTNIHQSASLVQH